MGSRRRFVKAMGVSLATLSGCSQPGPYLPVDDGRPDSSKGGTTSPDATPGGNNGRLTERFDTIYDVTEQGADSSGSEPVDEILASLVGDDTLLRFPAGTYRLNDFRVDGVSNFGMVGEDATLKLDRQGRTIFLWFRDVSDLLVEGFTVDNTAENTAAWCDLKVTGGTNVFRDYRVEGFVDVTERANGFTIMVEGGDTSLDLENVDISQGAINGTAAYVFPRREFYDPNRPVGSLTFRDCVMKGWGKEGLYASAHEGPLRVIGGEYANNGIDQVRVGGGNAPERAIVRDVTVRVDHIPDYMPESYRYLRGVWLKEGDGAIVENCDITLADVEHDQTPAAVLVHSQFGRATIRNCSITTENVSRPAILVRRPTDEYNGSWMPSLDHLPSEWGVTIENVSIDGHSPDSDSIHVIGRNECRITDTTVDTTGGASDGIGLYAGGRCTLRGGSVTTERFPVVIDFDGGSDCSLDVSDVSLAGRSLADDGFVLSRNGEEGYCIAGDTVDDSGRSNGELLALTRSERTATETPQGTTARPYRVYGRWVTV